MKLFVIQTFSVSGDRYTYCIKHPQKPTEKELKAFLIEHSTDKDGGFLFEDVVYTVEVSEDTALVIPSMSDEALDAWTIAEK